MSDRPAPPATTYRFGRRQRRGLLLGLSGPRVTAIGSGLVVIVIGLVLAGMTGAVLLAPLWVGLMAAALFQWHKRPVAEMIPTAAHFTARTVTTQDRYTARVSRPRSAGTMALPGDAAALRFHADESGAVMVHDPHARTLTAIVRI
ncbi:MAG TPA: SCO6880 family protein, partial [Rhodopila sp.]|nr:SCO6880 family protein [Rhodopila sp.]